jgi:hypothetical protein
LRQLGPAGVLTSIKTLTTWSSWFRTGGLGVIGIVLSVVGVVGAFWPIILLIVAALCAFGFMRTTGQR